MIIGICGNAGTGKSTALNFLKENYGVVCIEIDTIIENVIEHHLDEINDVLKEVYDLGPFKKVEIYDSYFDCGIASSIIDFEYRVYIDRLLFKELIKYKSKEKIIVLDWFMLELSKLFEICDYRIFLESNYEIRKTRVKNRGNYVECKFPLIQNVSSPNNLERYHLILNTEESNWLDILNNKIKFNFFGTNKVSVIVPVHNQEERLGRCIDSIQHSSYRNLEIIIVDDGSTDGTRFVINNYAKNDSRIVVIEQENMGVGNARNAGIKAAKGDYVGFVDSDDYIGINMIEVLLENALQTSADISRCCANMCERGEDYIPNRKKKRKNKMEVLDSKESIIDGYITRKISIAVWDKLFSRKIYSKVRFDETLFNEDAKYVWEACMVADKVCCSDEKLYFHVKREGANSLTGQPFDGRYFSVKTFCDEVEQELLKEKCDYSKEINIFKYNAYAHVIKTYMRDKKGNFIKDDCKKELTVFVNKIFEILFSSKKYREYHDLENVLDIIEFLREQNIICEENLIKYSLPAIGILWNSVDAKLADEVTEIVKKMECESIEMVCVDLGKDLECFIADIYALNDDKEFVVPLKIQCLVNRYNSNVIRILYFQQKVNKLTFLERKKNYVFLENEKLRTTIREFLKDRIDSYVFDTAFHLTDCESEYLYMKEVLKKYKIDMGENR